MASFLGKCVFATTRQSLYINASNRVNLCKHRITSKSQLTQQHRFCATTDSGNKDTQQSSTTTTSSNSRKWFLVGSLLGGCTLAGLAAWRWWNSDSKGPEDLLTMTVKRGVLSMQRREYEESQTYFHKALEMAYAKHKQKEIDDKQLLVMQVNIFGLMATASMKSGDFENAEKLYKETMKKCMEAGQSPDDESIIELSIKLASLYALMSRDEEAEAGFKYCIDIMDKSVTKAGGILEADTNTLALQGLSLQSFARFQMKKQKYTEGIGLFKKSLEIAREVYGADHPQALVVLNDLASAYVVAKEYKAGIETYKEAVERAEKCGGMDDSLVAFNYNLGEACILTGEFDAATAHCTRCMELAKKLDNPNLIKAAQQCLTDVSEEKAKKEDSKS